MAQKWLPALAVADLEMWAIVALGIRAAVKAMIMWVALYDLLIGLAMLPIGLMLAGAGGAGLWFLAKAQSRMHYLVIVISPIQAAAGIFLVYKSYDYLLRIFGVDITNWF
jgi:hypothetical protein